HSSLYPRYLHSFPTRRSSDLGASINNQIVYTIVYNQINFANGAGCVTAVSGTAGSTSCIPAAVNTAGSSSVNTYQNLAASVLGRSEEHTSELQSRGHLVCRLL